MAQASIKTETVEKVVLEEIEVGFTLELTTDEAETLRIITGLIGGLPAGRRGFINNIASALDQAGVTHVGDGDVIGNNLSGTGRGAIYFGAEVTR